MQFSVAVAESRLEPFDLFRNSSKRMPRPKHAYRFKTYQPLGNLCCFRIDTSLDMLIFSSVAPLPEIGFESREHAESAYDGRKETIEVKKSSRGLCQHLQNGRLPMALLFRYNGQYLLCGQDTFFLPYVSFALSKLHEMVFMSFLESFKCICCCSCGGLDFASVCINWSKQFTASILPPIETQRTNKNTE